MKQFYLFGFLLFLINSIFNNAIAQTDPSYFVTTWRVDGNDTSITIPTEGTGYDYDVDWEGDGIFDDTNVTGNATHDYGVAGTYTVQIRGDFPRIFFNNEGDKEKITDILQWGSVEWSTMSVAFNGCTNLIVSATDAPDLTNVTDMSRMFAAATSFNSPINHWDVSNITNMFDLFANTTSFNQDLPDWQTGSVTNMRGLFYLATSFNGNITDWNVSQVEDMYAMFWSAENFNQDIGGWNVASAENMEGMFRYARNFNQNLSSWDVSRVTIMTNMFDSARLSSANYDALLEGWAELSLQNNVNFNGGGSKYCQSEAFRNILTDSFSWTINDGGLCPQDLDDDGYLDGAFVTTWQTNNLGTSSSTSITIPTATDLGWTYNYDIDWNGDGVIDEFGLTGDTTHTYDTADTYTVQIIGDFPRIRFNGEGDAEKILTVAQWGNNPWDSMSSAFQGCTNLNFTATDVPDLSQVTSMHQMFEGATVFNSDINNWNVSTVEVMTHLFEDAISFNQDLNNWDVSSVTDMGDMFDTAIAFNGDISDWDVSSVTAMEDMFNSTEAFNVDIGGWNVSAVEDMSYMFRGATAFNQDISSWNVSAVTEMEDMFELASAFNQPIGSWDVSNVGSMNQMFHEATTFNQDLNDWDVSNVEDMEQMFEDAIAFNGDISNWDVSSVQIMSDMFDGAEVFNQPIGNWDVSSVTDMYDMFYRASAFNQDISSWEVSSVIDMAYMFDEAIAFNQPIDNWDVSSVEVMTGVFDDAISFNQPLNNWDVSNVQEMDNMFEGALVFNQDLSEWDVSNVDDMEDMLRGTAMSIENYDALLTAWSNLDLVDGIDFGAHNLTYCNAVAARDRLVNEFGWEIIDRGRNCNPGNELPFVTTWKTDIEEGSDDTTIEIPIDDDFDYNYDVDWNGDGIYDEFGLTEEAEHEYDVPGTYTVQIKGVFPAIYFDNDGDANKILTVEQWGDIEWQSMYYAFAGCRNLNFNAVDVPDLSKVTDMTGMFYEATAFNSPIGDWDVSNVTDMDEMFEEASSFNQDISAWDVSDVESMESMFEDASSFNQPLNGWDVGDVENMNGMFEDAEAFNQDISAWDVSNVYDMAEMFEGAVAFNQPLNSWDVSNVEYMYDMFEDATSFNQPLDNWDVSSVMEMWDMFYGATSFNQDLNTWDVSNVYDMEQMFEDAVAFNGAIDQWNVSSVEDMSSLFQGASSFNQDIGSWNVSNVEDMNDMFERATSFNQDISAWDVSNVEDMEYMFSEAIAFNSDISAWNVSNADNMSFMFNGAITFNQELGGWDVSNVSDMEDMFVDSGLTVNNYDALLIGWSALDLQVGVNFSVGELGYCLAGAERSIIQNQEWNITDGGLNCDAEAPANYSVSFDQSLSELSNVSESSFTITGAEIGSRYNYTISSSGDGNTVKIIGSGTLEDATAQVFPNLIELENGTLTLTLNLRDDNNNVGDDVTATTILNVLYTPQFIDPLPENLGGVILAAIEEANQDLPVLAGIPITFSFTFNDNGDKMFIADINEVAILEYNLSIPYDINSALLNNTFSLDDFEGISSYGLFEITFDSTGRHLLLLNAIDGSIFVLVLETPYDLDSVFDIQEIDGLDFSDFGEEIFSITFGNSVSDLYLGLEEGILQMDLNGSLTENNIDFVNDLYIGDEYILDITFNRTGTKLYALGVLPFGEIRSVIHEYTLSEPFDIGTARLENETTIVLGDSNAYLTDLNFNEEESKVYLSMVSENEETSIIISVDVVTSLSLEENTTSIVADVDANDGDGGAIDANLSYSLTSGDDNDLFLIDPSSGELSFLNPPNFENPLDADLDNVYEIEVIASDAQGTSILPIVITVTDVENDPPFGYTAVINQESIDVQNQESISFTYSNAEIGAAYNYAFSTDGGATVVSGSGTIENSEGQISNIDVTSVQDGSITLTFTLTNDNGTGGEATDTVNKETDSDNDGVNDTIDQCQDTPTGETVDANGCSDSQKDTDNDGVNDAIDECPNTLIGEVVSANGCSNGQTDTDEDGVNDDTDLCPDTPTGETVDANGCSDSQKDTDNDGVNDAIDECPNTPTGETVDTAGCSDSQTDTDEDGVNDDIDLCPDTRSEEMVDADGCSDSQKDTDNDGVNDAIDECPNTLIGEVVSANGCSNSQTDTDNDGINDADDQCPNTPEDEIAYVTGCSDSQIDSDSDGVSDADDLCPDTPDGETVDVEGCSLSQKDSDFDGVFDDVDNCINTPNEEQLDTDLDGLGNACDNDDDNDGVLDTDDEFPLDETENTDTDGDGVGDNADLDDDNDGTPDDDDAFPIDETEDTDTDGDGEGDNADLDDDNDGTPDEDDAFPIDETEDTDTDGDGEGDNADLDDDNDGTPDDDDAFPIDETEDTDTDGDGEGDNTDLDDDNDGTPDDEDEFPKDSTQDSLPEQPESLLSPAEAFTPNGDGINDSWIVPGIENYPNNYVKVFNRWGNIVYQTSNYQNDWQGFYINNNEKLPSGSYMYRIDLQDGSAPLQGWIYINY